jgi:tetratricopeptide (TPR) repeat protein
MPCREMTATIESDSGNGPDDAYEWFRRGYELHLRGRRRTEAEAAYRRAIAGGHQEAWLHLAMLISGRGRTDEEEGAYRAAMSCDDLPTASEAALRLGNLLDNLRGDLAGAQVSFEFARDYGRLETAQQARINLAVLLAYRGEREAAGKELRIYVDTRYADEDGDPFHARIAKGIVSAAGGRGTRSLLRKLRVVRFRSATRRQVLRVSMIGGRS